MPVEAPRADSAEQELSDFSYIVSHDLTASFRHVSQFSGLVMRELGADASGAMRSHGEQLQLATEKCQQMMDQLLVFSRVQQRPLNYARCNVTRLMEVAALQLSAEVGAAGAEVSIEPLGEPVVDAELVTMAFKHALSNAIKFRRTGAAPKISVRGSQTEDACIVQIADNGIGMAMERQEKMFRMFYQDHAEGVYPGVGAGLTICRRILRRHGGDAHFVNAELGACLEIVLPTVAGFVQPARNGDAL